MHCDLQKVLNMARKSPKVLLSPTFFEKICKRLEIDTKQTGDKIYFKKDRHRAEVPIITPENCARYKCVVREGKDGVMLYEFIIVLVKLLTDAEIPPSPHDKLGLTAEYYCEKGVNILEEKFS